MSREQSTRRGQMSLQTRFRSGKIAEKVLTVEQYLRKRAVAVSLPIAELIRSLYKSSVMTEEKWDMEVEALITKRVW